MPSTGRARTWLPALETVELVVKLTGLSMHGAALVINKRSPADAGELLARRHGQEAEHIRFVGEQLPQLAQFERPLMGEDVTTADALRTLPGRCLCRRPELRHSAACAARSESGQFTADRGVDL